MVLLFILFLFFQQGEKKPKATEAAIGNFIELRGREEVTLTPLLDTLDSEQEYKFKMDFAPKYLFSELYFDKGVAVRTENILTIRPSNKTLENDTATLKIVGFSNGGRILLYHKFIIEPSARVYPKLPKKVAYILLNNNVLERNSTYGKEMFGKNPLLEYYEENMPDSVIIEGITLSIVNKQIQKNIYTNKSVMNKEMIDEIKGLKMNTLTYIRLDVKIRKKRKSIWTRFTMKV